MVTLCFHILETVRSLVDSLWWAAEHSLQNTADGRFKHGHYLQSAITNSSDGYQTAVTSARRRVAELRYRRCVSGSRRQIKHCGGGGWCGRAKLSIDHHDEQQQEPGTRSTTAPPHWHHHCNQHQPVYTQHHHHRNIKTWTWLPVEESIRKREDRDKYRKYVHGVAKPRIEDG